MFKLDPHPSLLCTIMSTNVIRFNLGYRVFIRSKMSYTDLTEDIIYYT